MVGHARRLGLEQSFDRHVSRLVDVFEQVARSRSRADFTNNRPLDDPRIHEEMAESTVSALQAFSDSLSLWERAGVRGVAGLTTVQQASSEDQR